MESTHITSPISEPAAKELTAGTQALISGVIYVARDAAHLRIVQTLDRGEPPPFDFREQTVYYMGPSPARPGQVIGSAGPTTSSRMDMFTPRLLSEGLRGMIGKGNRSTAVREAIQKYNGVYFITLGGAAALLAKAIKKSETVAYPELGAEAVLRLEVVDFPAIVAYDAQGGDFFEQAKAKYRREEG
jgi:fumarate hydratase subunit beta